MSPADIIEIELRLRAMLRLAELRDQSLELAIENARLREKLDILRLKQRLRRRRKGRKSLLREQQWLDQVRSETRDLLTELLVRPEQ